MPTIATNTASTITSSLATITNTSTTTTSTITTITNSTSNQILMALPVVVLLKKNVKVTLVQALRLCTGRPAYRGSRGIALPFHDHGTRRG